LSWTGLFAAIDHGFNPFAQNCPNADSDADGLTDLEELRHGTNPRKPDTDDAGNIIVTGHQTWIDSDIDADGWVLQERWSYDHADGHD